ATGGGPRGARLADGVCATGRPAPGALSRVWAALGVHWRGPARGCAAAGAGGGACGMRAGRREEARQGRGAPADGWGTASDALLQRVGASRGLARAVRGLGTALIVSPDGRR